MDWVTFAASALKVVVLLYVATADLAARLIPNRACLILAIAGITARLAAGSMQLIESGLVAIALFLLLVGVHHRGWIGGGDVKLLAALAVGLPFAGVLQLMTIMALAGVVLAMVHVAMRLLPYPVRAPAGSSLLRRVYAVERWRCLRRAPLPYGVAIAVGGIWTVLSRGV